MRIAVFHELHFGGARRASDEFAKRLKGHHTIDLFYIDEHEDKDVNRYYHSVSFNRFVPKNWSGNDWNDRLYKDTIELYRLYLLHRGIASEINKGGYDVVLVHPSKFTQAPFILRFLQIPSIYYCQEPLRIVYDSYFSQPKHIPFPKNIYEMINRQVRKRIDRTNLLHASRLLANSKYSQQSILRAYGRESTVCYLGVDTTKFKPMNMKKTYDVLFVGLEDPLKGYDLLQETLKHFTTKPNIKIVSRKINGVGITDEKLVEEYNKSRIVVALGRNEPFGLIPIEAMACGVPVVALAEGGLRESVIDGKTGYLVKPDAKIIARSLESLLDNKKVREEMGEYAREYVLKNWTWEKSTASLLKNIRKL